MFIFATGMSRLRTSVKSLKAEAPTLRARGLPTTSNKQSSRLRCHPQALTRSARVPSPQSPKLQLVRRVRLGPLLPLLIPLRPLLHKLPSSHASLLSASQRPVIKKSTFCNSPVNSYREYIDVDARHLFFCFFESRCDTSKDDVIFWTYVGPECSSAISLFMELGPCTVVQDCEDDAEIKLKNHPQSWNEFSIAVGLGFSYAEHGERVVSRFLVMLLKRL